MSRLFKLTLPALLIALPLAACGDNGNTNGGDSANNGASNGEELVVTDRNAGGIHSQAGANLNVPAGFPDDIAIYDGLNIYGANDMGPMGYTLTAISDASIEEIAAFYSREMAAQGWSEESAAVQGNSARAMRFQKGTRMTTVNLLPNGETTAVTISALNVPQ